MAGLSPWASFARHTIEPTMDVVAPASILSAFLPLSDKS